MKFISDTKLLSCVSTVLVLDVFFAILLYLQKRTDDRKLVLVVPFILSFFLLASFGILYSFAGGIIISVLMNDLYHRMDHLHEFLQKKLYYLVAFGMAYKILSYFYTMLTEQKIVLQLLILTSAVIFALIKIGGVRFENMIENLGGVSSLLLKFLFVLYFVGLCILSWLQSKIFDNNGWVGFILLSVRFLGKALPTDYKWEPTLSEKEESPFIVLCSYLACRKVLLWCTYILFYDYLLKNVQL